VEVVIIIIIIIIIIKGKGKGNAVPLQTCSSPEVKVPRFHDSGTGWW